MRDLYPPESQRLDIIAHLEELRKRLLIILGSFLLISTALFIYGRPLVMIARIPIQGLVTDLIFITPAEAFVSYIKLVLLGAFIISFPLIIYQAWLFLAPAFRSRTRSRIILWLLSALLLFYAGLLFSYALLIPAALKFLLSFGRDLATAAITFGEYVSFFTLLLLAGGLVFEIPTVIGLLTDIGILKTALLKKYRRYTILLILILAAIITPTHDIVNLLLLAVPMAFLYEAGILIAGLVERSRNKKE